MSNDILNIDSFEDNCCYGCGHNNVNGLKIEIIKDATKSDTLLAEFNARNYMEGAPGLIHNGSIFTAMDCLATWTPMIFVPELKAIWRTHTTQIEYLGIAFIDQPLLMSAHITASGQHHNPVSVHVEANNSAGELVAKADFELIPYSESEYIKTTGIDPIPQNWLNFLKG